MNSSKEIILDRIIETLPQFRENLMRMRRAYPPDADAPLWELRNYLADLREEFSEIHYDVLQYIDHYQHELNQQIDEQHDPIVDRS